MLGPPGSQGVVVDLVEICQVPGASRICPAWAVLGTGAGGPKELRGSYVGCTSWSHSWGFYLCGSLVLGLGSWNNGPNLQMAAQQVWTSPKVTWVLDCHLNQSVIFGLIPSSCLSDWLAARNQGSAKIFLLRNLGEKLYKAVALKNKYITIFLVGILNRENENWRGRGW